MNRKKLLAVLLSMGMVLGMTTGCGSSTDNKDSSTDKTEKTEEKTESTEKTETTESKESTASASAITLWTYPIGSWGNETEVNKIIENFNVANPDIKVSVEYLDYTSGDDQVTAAIEAGTTPDIIMEGPERLVSNWGAAGKMVDLSDLWDEATKSDIGAVSEAVVSACQSTDGSYYEYPLCMNAHCMAINYEMFEQADALKYIDEKTRTWTTDDFEKAMKALKDNGVTTTGVVYCGGQGGDQGTRALAMNLYGAEFTNADHTEWTMNSTNGVKGLQKLVDMTKEGTLSYDAGIVASDELQLFANGTTAMTFCWNASNQKNYAEQVTFTPYAVAFPAESGEPELAGGIYGFGVFDNGDMAKADAAKKFIQYVCDDKEQGPASVVASGFFPVRDSFGNVYAGSADEERMNEFSIFMPYLGDYYNVTAGWADQRTAWWNLLQQIFGGADVQQSADSYVETCNAATAAASK